MKIEGSFRGASVRERMGLTEVRTYSKYKPKSPPQNNSANNNVIKGEPPPCCGTEEGTIIWYNTNDISGICLSSVVWAMILFSLIVVLMLSLENGEKYFSSWNAYAIVFLCAMALWSHGATMLGDPGAVPESAKPLAKDIEDGPPVQCGVCEAYKPPGSHHCGVSGRCISRMDHFCPWTNK